MNSKPHGNGNGLNRFLSLVLIILLSATILAVIVMGGMFAMRILGSDPLPAVTASPVTDSVTASPVTGTEDTNTTNAASTDTPATAAPNTTAPSTTAPTTDATTQEPVTMPTDVPVTPQSIYLNETADGGDAYLKRVVFLGDSTTYHMHHYTDLDDSQIWVPAAGTLDLNDITSKSVAMPVAGVDFRDWVDAPISSVLASVKPDILIVTLGINCSSFYGKEEHGWTMDKKETYFKLQISNIQKLVQQNSPNTTLIFQTIYPVIDAELIEDGSPIRSEHVKLRNSWLIEICTELNIPVLKTEDVLMDENGALKKEYNTYHLDGVHINPEGYNAILNYVRTHTVP